MRNAFFSAKAEYALMAMLELAQRHAQPGPIRLKTLADAHAIPKRFLVQILLQLKASGLIDSTRGASGGYQLARDPEKISLLDILGTIDNLDTTPDSPGERDRLSPVQLGLRDLGNELLVAQQKILAATSLQEFAKRCGTGEVLMYTI